MRPAQASSVRSRCRRLFRIAALLTFIGCVGFWAARGARLGWSQHRVPIQEVDEVTGLDYVRYEERFVPGLEWLAGGCAVAVLLFGASFLVRSKLSQST